MLCENTQKYTTSCTIMQLWHYSFVIFTWMMCHVFILSSPGCSDLSQSLSDNCSNMTKIVNCSHRGIVYRKGDHFNNTSIFTCNVCCGGSCCEVREHISLKIVPNATTGGTAEEQRKASYFITLNTGGNILCNKSIMISNLTEDTSNILNLKEIVHHETVLNSTSETSKEFHGTDNDSYSIIHTNWNSEFENSSATSGNVHLDISTASSGVTLDIFSGFNGSNNYLTECPCFDEWSNLEWIDLSSNHISVISKSFGNLAFLHRLFLKNNNVSVVNPIFFSSLPSLSCLHLNDNPTILDWTFLNRAPSLRVVNIHGSCSSELKYSGFLISCKKNVTLVTNNTSCIQNKTECTLNSTWPTVTCRPLVFSLTPCQESHSNQSFRNITVTDVGVSENDDSGDENTSNPPEAKFCAYFKGNHPYLASDYNCIWISISVLTAIVCVGVAIAAVFKWRMRVKRQGRYTRWLSVYSKKSSDSEYQADIIHAK